MNTKQTLLLIAVLITGFLAGFLIAGRMARHRIHHMIERHQPQSMPHRMMEIIEPDENQRDDVERILEKYADTLRQLRRTHRQDLKSVHLSLQKELRPVLSEKQFRRLEHAQKRMMRPPREKKKQRRE